MSTKPHYSRMTVDIPEEDHKRLKVLAAILGVSIREIIANLVHERLHRYPNAETLEAIDSVQKRKDLVEATDLDDLFHQLGI